MAFQGMDREKMPFLFSTKLFFQFLIWSIGSECIWRKLTKDEICWLRGNIIYSSLTTSTRTFLCVAAMEEVFWAAVAVFEIKLKKKWRSNLFQIRELSICNIQTTRQNEHWGSYLQFPTVPISLTAVVLALDYFGAMLEPVLGKHLPNLKLIP